ncbi:hypothetical protein OG946_23890 [Streptomyces sp. NBC_01808]|uniref:hypothetical protein n=1 Tax=Streptomyces sp. NBC_01808 TaxID=2975947 RepID=UPI002DD7F415|nr:hypothetical protein [Streptomyces sp. NBC_01808]WSA40139.1 hypothetical protein OG946_23890 [Streptomyces sp. NBC_01808]
MDLGIVNIATASTGYQAAGRRLNRYRKRQLALRRKLQKNASHVLARRGESVWTAGGESRAPAARPTG